MKINLENLVRNVQQYIDENCGGGNMIIFTIIEMFCDQHSNTDNVSLVSCVDGVVNNENEINNPVINTICTALDTLDTVFTGLEINPMKDKAITMEISKSEILLNQIIHGPSYSDRKSVFIGHCCPVTSIEEVDIFFNYIKMDKRYRSATHNILAYRYTNSSNSTNTSMVTHDYDDDGESAAGGRMAELMRLIPVENVAVVVSRWFGGIKLGPERY